jgi:hypothetical protein
VADTTHTLEVITRIRDLASVELRKIGAEGVRAGTQVEQAASRAERRFMSVGESSGRAIGKEAKHAFGSLAIGISSAATAAEGLEGHVVQIGANLAAAFAVGGPAGLGVAAVSIGLGQLIGTASSASARMVEFAKQTSEAVHTMVTDIEDARVRTDQLRLVLKSSQTGIPVESLKTWHDLDEEAKHVGEAIEGAEKRIQALKSTLAKGVSDDRGFFKRLGDMVTGKRSPMDQSGVMRDQVGQSLSAQQGILQGLQEKLRQIGEQRKLFDEANAVALTRELEKQLHLLRAHTDMEKLLATLEEQRKDVAAKTSSDPKALAAFDQAAAQAKLNLNKKLNDEYKSALEAITAVTERQKIEAQYAKGLRDAEGDTLKIQQAQAIYAAQLVALQRKEKEDAIAKRNAANDYVQSLREQTAILKDQTGEVAKQIDNVHRLKEAFDKAGKEGVKAEKDRQKAEKDAETKGETGTYHDGHMDKGLATARERRRKRLHESKYRKGAFHNKYDENGTLVPDMGIPFDQQADFSFGKRFPDKPAAPPPPPQPQGPPVTTPAEGPGGTGLADAIKTAAENAKKAAEEAKRDKEATDKMAEATGDVNSALKDNATAQEKATAAMHDLASTASTAIIKNAQDLQKVADEMKKLAEQLKAQGSLR